MVAAVDDQRLRLLVAESDVAGDFVEVGAGDEGAEVGFGVRCCGLGAVAYAEVGDAGFEFAEEGVGGVGADGYGDGDGHAALAG